LSEVAPALLVDLYELTMADAYRRTGTADREATFSLFVRTLPKTRGYLVAAGLDDVLTWLEDLQFDDAALGAIDRLGIFGDEFLSWLGALRFRGTVRAVPEGTIVFGEEPILEVDAPIGVAQLAETFLLNQVTVQTALASKAARVRHAADGRAVVDFGARRSQGVDAAMKLARVCHLVGFDATSNVAAADRYGMRASGTMAHSFVQAHPDELQAFRDFARQYREATVLLVDTYDTIRGVARAIEVASELRAQGSAIRAVRLDSGDLAALAHESRRMLDDAGFPEIEIFASGGLDEDRIDTLLHEQRAPIDGFGVGTALAVADDAPSLDTVYKLVAFDGRAVRKRSEGKATWPGAKQVWRAADWSGDVLALAGEESPASHAPLLETVMRGGERTAAGRVTLDDARAAFEAIWRQLPAGLRRLRQPVAHPVRASEALRELTARFDAAPH
jgi:nicotinate phosphoribosyltransferase